jgi:hypothetical protein
MLDGIQNPVIKMTKKTSLTTAFMKTVNTTPNLRSNMPWKDQDSQNLHLLATHKEQLK